MFQKKLWLYGLVVFGLCCAIAPKGHAQAVFRVGVWCLVGDGDLNPAIFFNQTFNTFSVKGPERDKLLNLGLNYLLGCVNLDQEDAMVFMGDSLDSAPIRKEFKSTLKIVPATPLFTAGYEIKWLAITANLFIDPLKTMAWRDSVNKAYKAMYSRDSARIDGVHSFFAAEEGCINTANHIPGINYMSNHAIIDGFVQLAYVQSPNACHTATTYEMAKGLHRADHLMSGNYILQNNPFTLYTGLPFQTRMDLLVGSLADARRGIRDADTTSNATFWSVVQTQQSTNPQINLRLPTKAEILCFVNLSLAYGAKGITYYPYSTLLGTGESGLLTTSRATTAQYDSVRTINTNYQNTGKSLVTIGANFLNLTWKEGFSIHQPINQNEPISSPYKLYDVTSKIPGGATDAESETYVEVGVLQNGSTNYYMVVNRRCTASETREVTLTFQSTAGNAYRITDVQSGDSTTYYTAGTTFAHTITLGPGEGKLLKFSNLGPRSGTISSNTTWAGTYVVNIDVTVNNGATLTISPGATLKFASAKSLTINGKLAANSTDPNKRLTFTGQTATPGFWNGLTINSGSSANNSTLRRCDVQYAVTGLTINYAGNTNNVTIDKCKVQNNSSQGIYIAGNGSGAIVHPIISNSTISNNNIDGIYLTNYTKLKITGNRIENNGYAGIEGASNDSDTLTFNYIAGNLDFGVRLSYSSSGLLYRNSIKSNFGTGVFCFSNSNVTAWGGADTTKGRNEIASNSGVGIYASSSAPTFGRDIVGQYGWNWIHDNSSYEAQQTGAGYTFFAERCWWSGQQGDVAGNVDALPTNASQPSPTGWGKGSSYDPTFRIWRHDEDNKDSLAVLLPLAEIPSFMQKSAATIQAFNGLANWSEDLSAAIEEGRKTGDWGSANVLITELHRELQGGLIPEVDFALVNQYAADLKISAFIRQMLALVLMEKELAGNNVTAALEKLTAFARSNADQTAELTANAGLIHLYRQNDLPAAQNILTQLQDRAQTGDDVAAEHVKHFGRILQDYQRRQSANESLAKHNTTSTLLAQPETPALAQNYPNPFNPATTIRFHLNEQQKVRLLIFDLNGKLVRTLLDDELAAGEQTVLWDGRDQQGRVVASGVYFYELTAEDKIERKKMTLIR